MVERGVGENERERVGGKVKTHTQGTRKLFPKTNSSEKRESLNITTFFYKKQSAESEVLEVNTIARVTPG